MRNKIAVSVLFGGMVSQNATKGGMKNEEETFGRVGNNGVVNGGDSATCCSGRPYIH